MNSSTSEIYGLCYHDVNLEGKTEPNLLLSISHWAKTQKLRRDASYRTNAMIENHATFSTARETQFLQYFLPAEKMNVFKCDIAIRIARRLRSIRIVGSAFAVDTFDGKKCRVGCLALENRFLNLRININY